MKVKFIKDFKKFKAGDVCEITKPRNGSYLIEKGFAEAVREAPVPAPQPAPVIEDATAEPEPETADAPRQKRAYNRANRET